MRHHHQGSGHLAVIPAGWAAAHRPVAEGTMTAAASIRIPGGTQAWSDAEQQNVEVPNAPYFTGPCRVQALINQANQTVVGDDPETVAAYLITVSATANPVEKHLVTVTDTDDPALDGRVLQIRQVVRGSLLFERDLICTLSD